MSESEESRYLRPGKTRILMYLPEALGKRLKKAAKEGSNMTAVVVAALEAYLPVGKPRVKLRKRP